MLTHVAQLGFVDDAPSSRAFRRKGGGPGGRPVSEHASRLPAP
ncbi:MAG: hypothetical protein ACREQ5_36475 [Candidatus Dormibacteria bacterium]